MFRRKGMDEPKPVAMQYGAIPDVRLPVSRLIQGTASLREDREAWSFGLLDAAFSLGCTTFDTAHIYTNGDCQRILGRWMKVRGVRDKVVVIDKGAHHNDDRKRVTPFDITSDLHDNLARLQTDYIDLFLLHRDDPSQPVGPIMDMLNEHKAAGRIHAFGVSNWTRDRVAEANAYAAAHGLTPLVASSPHFSLGEMVSAPWEGCISIAGPEHAADRAWYAQSGMAVIAWSSLCAGFFSGRFKASQLNAMPGGEDAKLYIRCYRSKSNLDRLTRAEKLAKEKRVSVAQVVLAYMARQGMDVYAVTFAESEAEFRQTMGAFDLELAEQECEWIDMRTAMA